MRSRSVAVAGALVLAASACAAGTSPPPEQAAEPTPTASLEPPTPTPTPAPATPTPEPGRPNIIVFYTDDQTVEQMRVMARTTALLAERGATFTQSFANVPLCCPSRATLLTGQHASNHGVLSNGGFNGGFANFENQEATLATGLQAAGYHTLFVGKYLNGYGRTADLRFVPPGWSTFQGLISPAEIFYYEPSFVDDGTIVSYPADAYVTDVMTREAVEVIEDTVVRGEPLFAVLSYPAPHAQGGVPLAEYDPSTFFDEIRERYPNLLLAPPVPAPRHAGTLAQERAPRGPAYDEADNSDKPHFIQRPRFDADLAAEIDAYYRAGLESLLSVDESVADVVDLIEQMGAIDRTWFFFTSDNGQLYGDHRFYGVKYLPYEGSVRVPLVVRGPGVAEGVELNAVVSNVDLATTIYDIAGVEPDRPPDGRSLLGLLTGREAPWGRAVLLEGYELGRGARPYRGVHTGDSVYVEWATGPVELYDLMADPYQLENLAEAPGAAALHARNEDLLRRLETCAGPACATVGSDELEPPGPPGR